MSVQTRPIGTLSEYARILLHHLARWWSSVVKRERDDLVVSVEVHVIQEQVGVLHFEAAIR